MRDAATGKVVRALIANSSGSGTVEGVTTISFAPDGRRALSVKGATLSLWDVAQEAEMVQRWAGAFDLWW